MKKASLLLLAAVAVIPTDGAVGQTSEELAARVRATEIAFAATMADRDLDSFLSHVASGQGNPGYLRVGKRV